jgi:Zn-dependent protease with chaperone function
VDFFTAQDSARRKTWQLVVLFGAAVLGLIVLTNLLVAAVVTFSTTQGVALGLEAGIRSMPTETWLFISAAVITVVVAASLYKYAVVRSGGRAVAEMLGGRPIDPASRNRNERRLLNVVEEMAIAAGLPVPPVYLIDEPGINAFAAGLNSDDTVIGVTRGTLTHLSRDELQGVIGHEFSHVLNGDTGINLRLIATLHGILFLGLVGQTLLRGSHFNRRSRGSAPILAMGVGLLVIGFAGTFFGNLIKAAVSRQREFLADAASVQFTRNPTGIAGALKKIGGASSGSLVNAPHTAEMSHLFFGQAVKVFFNQLMATHPPLERRIRAVDPSWDGQYPVLTADVEAARGGVDAEAVAGFAGHPGTRTSTADVLAVEVDPNVIVDEVGHPTEDTLSVATDLIASTSDACTDAARDPWAARALLYAMLLSHDPAHRAAQKQLIAAKADQGVPDHLARLEGPVEQLDAPRRLMLISLAMPALKSLSHPQYERFVEIIIGLIKTDRRIELFEWVCHRLLVKELKPHFEGAVQLPVRYRRIEDVALPAVELVSALARLVPGAGADAAFAAGIRELGLRGAHITQPDPNLTRLSDALKHLRLLNPLLKPKILKACAATVLHDALVTSEETTLLQGVAATLDCPLPPLVS